MPCLAFRTHDALRGAFEALNCVTEACTAPPPARLKNLEVPIGTNMLAYSSILMQIHVGMHIRLTTTALLQSLGGIGQNFSETR